MPLSECDVKISTTFCVCRLLLAVDSFVSVSTAALSFCCHNTHTHTHITYTRTRVHKEKPSRYFAHCSLHSFFIHRKSRLNDQFVSFAWTMVLRLSDNNDVRQPDTAELSRNMRLAFDLLINRTILRIGGVSAKLTSQQMRNAHCDHKRQQSGMHRVWENNSFGFSLCMQKPLRAHRTPRIYHLLYVIVMKHCLCVCAL